MRTSEEFWAKVDRAGDGCWLWQGGAGDGHGIINWQGNVTKPYRIAVELSGRPIPPAMSVHHLCEVPLCCRPDHLLIVTEREHRAFHRSSHCIHGHPLAAANLGVVASGKNVGMRYCRTCARLRMRKRNAGKTTKRRYVTPEMREKIISLHLAGHTMTEIGRRVGVSRRSVTRALDPAWTPFVPGIDRPEDARRERAA